jgi:hypothetical protein
MGRRGFTISESWSHWAHCPIWEPSRTRSPPFKKNSAPAASASWWMLDQFNEGPRESWDRASPRETKAKGVQPSLGAVLKVNWGDQSPAEPTR